MEHLIKSFLGMGKTTTEIHVILINGGMGSLEAAQLIAKVMGKEAVQEKVEDKKDDLKKNAVKKTVKKYKPLNRNRDPRRDVLWRRHKAGQLEAMRVRRYTDDYRYDNDTNFGKTEWGLVLDERQFRGLAGAAWWNADGTITLLVHSNESYKLREIVQ